MQTLPKPVAKKATVGFALSLTGGILILLQGTIRLVRAQWIVEFGMDEFRRRIFGEVLATTLGIIAVVFGIIVIIGAYLIYQLGKEVVGGILVIVFSAVSIFTGGGYLIGLILGIVGGALGLAKR